MWPPENFEIRVEEVHIGADGPRVVKRFRALANGVVTYATSTRSLVDPESKTQLPVFDRMCAYRLVPTSIRALARRIHRSGVLDLDTRQGERGMPATSYLVLAWQGMDRSAAITATGRVHGPMADILSIVMAHMPEGEVFDLPGLADRPVVPVLRGVPAPRMDGIGALVAHTSLLAERPEDRTLLEDAFALACRLGHGSEARNLLQRWTAATADERRLQETFPEGEAILTPVVLQRFLPAGS
jgi:hypothetical protein